MEELIPKINEVSVSCVVLGVHCVITECTPWCSQLHNRGTGISPRAIHGDHHRYWRAED